MNRRPGYVHRSVGLALLSVIPSMFLFQGLVNLAGGHEGASPTFYRQAQDYADVECDWADPVRFDTCWRTALADFYRLEGKV